MDQTPQPSLPASAPPAAPAAATEDPAKQRRLKNGTTFLQNPQVQASPLSRRVNFLKSKGLSVEEIHECFQRAGQPQNLDELKKIESGSSTSASAPAAAPAPPPASAVAPAAVAQPGAAPGQPQIVYVQHPGPAQPQLPLPPTPGPDAKKASASWTWKDYFIGTTLAVAGTAATVKAFQAWSPFEIVRKGSTTTTTQQQPMLPSPNVQRMQSGFFEPSDQSIAPQQRQLQQQQQPEVFGLQRQQSLMPSTSQIIQPTMELPSNQSNQATAATSRADDTTAVEEFKKEIDDLKEQLKTVKDELEEKGKTLEKERREKAEMAVTSAKAKATVTQLNRAVERTKMREEELMKDLNSSREETAALRSKLDSMGQQGTAVADSGKNNDNKDGASPSAESTQEKSEKQETATAASAVEESKGEEDSSTLKVPPSTDDA